MPAVTIRSLSDDVHAQLRDRAAAAHMSMESFVRRTLAEATMDAADHKTPAPTGFAEASAAFIHAGASASSVQPTGLWGALKGSVSIAPGCDLTAPTGEAWSAET